MAVAGRECPLCEGGGTWIEVDGFPSGTFRECKCTEGGVLLAWPHRSVAEYEARYQGTYHDEEMVASGRQAFVARDTEYLAAAHARLTRLRVAYPGSRFLIDVGCGTGSLVALAPAFGLSAHGLEPNPAMVAWGSSQGRSMNIGTWRGPWVGMGKWDIACLFDVLEHLVEPEDALQLMHDQCHVLVVEMPEYLAPGGNWRRHAKELEHPVLYSRQAAEALFGRCGFVVDEFFRPLAGSLGKMCHYLRAK